MNSVLAPTSAKDLAAESRAMVSVPARDRLPGLLQHLQRLTHSFTYRGRSVSYINIYAKPVATTARNRSRMLELIVAQESGFEGIACVDDVARAAILALQVYEQMGSEPALALAREWLAFLEYMQGTDGRFTNFIVDEVGTRNLRGLTSRTGGSWWTARAMWALATAWRVTKDPRYHRRFLHGRLASTTDMKIKAVHALALMEAYAVQPNTALLTRICGLCDAIVASGPRYFQDNAATSEVAMWGYHQLQAVARAGRLFSRLDYIAASERTVESLIEPVIAGGFYHRYPTEQDRQCAYDISTLVLGLEELYLVTHQSQIRDLALQCASWFDGNNSSGTVMYDPRTGCCSDGISNGEASLNCGAESSIEAGFVELARRRLRKNGRRRIVPEPT